MDKDKLVELAERCETATGPNAMLDEAIYEARGIEPSRNHSFVYPHYAFTSSIDAAMTLVPEGWLWARDIDQIFCLYPPEGSSPEIGFHESCDALALCAAALRAHTQQQVNNERKSHA